MQALFAGQGLTGITPAQANVLMALFQAKQPLTAHVVSAKNNEPQFLAPIPYEFVA